MNMQTESLGVKKPVRVPAHEMARKLSEFAPIGSMDTKTKTGAILAEQIEIKANTDVMTSFFSATQLSAPQIKVNPATKNPSIHPELNNG